MAAADGSGAVDHSHFTLTVGGVALSAEPAGPFLARNNATVEGAQNGFPGVRVRPGLLPPQAA